nr:hypothetical protein [uncultured Rhodopila sp.]
MDANHFRNRAAKAREMARAGDDARLAEMLLEVALDLEAEADAIEAEQRDAEPMLTEPAENHPSWIWRPLGPARELNPAASVPAGERIN